MLYIPAHTSHRLQPLDVACFGPIKTVYRRALAETGMPTLTAPASKQRFISIYESSRNRCLNSSNIEADFAATGISPFEPSRVLNELLQPEAPHEPQTPPSTQSDRLFWTLSSRRDISRITYTLLNSVSSSRTSQYLTRQFEEAIACLITRKAAKRVIIKAKLQILKLQLEPQSKECRQPVRIDPHERFAHIEDFMSAARSEGG